MKVRKGVNRKMIAGRKKERRWGTEKGERRNRRELEGRRVGWEERMRRRKIKSGSFLSFSFFVETHVFSLPLFFLIFYFVLEYSRLTML